MHKGRVKPCSGRGQGGASPDVQWLKEPSTFRVLSTCLGVKQGVALVPAALGLWDARTRGSTPASLRMCPAVIGLNEQMFNFKLTVAEVPLEREPAECCADGLGLNFSAKGVLWNGGMLLRQKADTAQYSYCIIDAAGLGRELTSFEKSLKKKRGK